MIERIPTITYEHNYGAAFWIQPVRCKTDTCIDALEDVVECDEAEVSLDEGDVEGFLAYYFKRFFDENLVYNQQRRDDYSGAENRCIPACFEWYLTHNFYTFPAMESMIEEISKAADTLDNEGLASMPTELVEEYKKWFAFESSEPLSDDREILSVVNAHTALISDYYRRFVAFIRKMLKDYTDWPLISIMGP